MVLHVGLCGFDQGFVPQAMAAGTLPRLVFAHPILTDVKPQERQPGLIAFQGMANATFGFVEAQSHLGQPRLEQFLSVLEHLAIFV
jgi:hypothetical protein